MSEELLPIEVPEESLSKRKKELQRDSKTVLGLSNLQVLVPVLIKNDSQVHVENVMLF